MKNFSFLLFLFITNLAVSQRKIDTTQVDYVRYEWEIDAETTTTTLNSKFTKYKSGFYLEEFKFVKDSSKYGHFILFKAKEEDLLQRVFYKDYATGLGDALVTTYYDIHENPDSIVYTIEKEKTKKIVIPIEKKYKTTGKLAFITDEEGSNHHTYYAFGNLTQIQHFRDSVLYRIDTYDKNRLTTQVFPTRKKHRKKFIYAYDEKGRIIKRADDDYYFFRYQYNAFG
ncbi:MAG: hypothetical protein AAF617_12095 [Bacteroidota bacterium]